MAWIFLVIARFFETGWAIGTRGTARLGIVLMDETATLLRPGCIGLFVVGMIGLKMAGR